MTKRLAVASIVLMTTSQDTGGKLHARNVVGLVAKSTAALDARSLIVFVRRSSNLVVVLIVVLSMIRLTAKLGT